jgi:hypothetical protein
MPEQLLEGFCEGCIFLMAEQQTKAAGSLSRDAISKAKASIDGETAGLFSPGMLDVILDDLIDQAEIGEDVSLAKEKAKNDIQSLGGIGACREMIKMAESLGQFAHQVEEEARRKLGVLMKFRKQ